MSTAAPSNHVVKPVNDYLDMTPEDWVWYNVAEAWYWYNLEEGDARGRALLTRAALTIACLWARRVQRQRIGLSSVPSNHVVKT